MEDIIPKSAPLKDKEKLLKPLEISSNASSERNTNIINMKKNFDQNFIIPNLQKSFSNKLIKQVNRNSKKQLKMNIQSINTGVNVNIIEGVIPEKNKKKKQRFENQEMPKTSPYNFKYFCNTANKKSINQALSNKNNLKSEKKVLESNFIKLSKEANM